MDRTDKIKNGLLVLTKYRRRHLEPSTSENKVDSSSETLTSVDFSSIHQDVPMREIDHANTDAQTDTHSNTMTLHGQNHLESDAFEKLHPLSTRPISNLLHPNETGIVETTQGTSPSKQPTLPHHFHFSTPDSVLEAQSGSNVFRAPASATNLNWHANEHRTLIAPSADNDLVIAELRDRLRRQEVVLGDKCKLIDQQKQELIAKSVEISKNHKVIRKQTELLRRKDAVEQHRPSSPSTDRNKVEAEEWKSRYIQSCVKITELIRERRTLQHAADSNQKSQNLQKLIAKLIKSVTVLTLIRRLCRMNQELEFSLNTERSKRRTARKV